MRAWRGIAVLGVAALTSPTALGGTARAEDWTYEDEEAAENTRWRYSARTAVWVGTFDRPQRACDPSRLLVPGIEGLSRSALRPAQVFGPFCPHDESDEIGVSAGIDVSFRVIGPVHVTMGLDLIYTQPDAQILKNQVVVAVPFGLLITWYDWVFRPIVHSTISPVVFITDSNRDFTGGIAGGGAYRIPRFGDVSFTVGHNWSESVDHWAFAFAIHPL